MVFFTARAEEYSMIRYKLIINGIKVKTKIMNHSEFGNFSTISRKVNEYYEIYVQSKEIKKANRIIKYRKDDLYRS